MSFDWISFVFNINDASSFFAYQTFVSRQRNLTDIIAICVWKNFIIEIPKSVQILFEVQSD